MLRAHNTHRTTCAPPYSYVLLVRRSARHTAARKTLRRRWRARKNQSCARLRLHGVLEALYQRSTSPVVCVRSAQWRDGTQLHGGTRQRLSKRKQLKQSFGVDILAPAGFLGLALRRSALNFDDLNNTLMQLANALFKLALHPEVLSQRRASLPAQTAIVVHNARHERTEEQTHTDNSSCTCQSMSNRSMEKTHRAQQNYAPVLTQTPKRYRACGEQQHQAVRKRAHATTTTTTVDTPPANAPRPRSSGAKISIARSLRRHDCSALRLPRCTRPHNRRSPSDDAKRSGVPQLSGQLNERRSTITLPRADSDTRSAALAALLCQQPATARAWQPVCAMYKTLWLSTSDEAVRAADDWYDNGPRFDDVLLRVTLDTAPYRRVLPWARVRVRAVQLHANLTADCAIVEPFELVHGEARARTRRSTGAPLVRLSGRQCACSPATCCSACTPCRTCARASQRMSSASTGGVTRERRRVPARAPQRVAGRSLGSALAKHRRCVTVNAYL